MKTKLLYTFIFLQSLNYAQNFATILGNIKVLVKNKETNLPIDTAYIEVLRNDSLFKKSVTISNGESYIKDLLPGIYDVRALKNNFFQLECKGVRVGEGKTAYVTLVLDPLPPTKKSKKKGKKKGVRIKMIN